MRTRRRYTEDQKLQWLQEWEDSAKSVVIFCEDKPFSTNSLYTWKKKYSEQNNNFVLLPPSISINAVPIVIQYPNGNRVELNTFPGMEIMQALIQC